MNSNTIAIRITVNDDGSHVIQQFGANASRGFQKAEQSANLTTTAFQTMKRTYFELTAAAAAVSVAAYKVADALMASAKASIEMERLRVAMESALGSSVAMSSAIGFIRAESDRLGLSFQDQTKAYTKLAAAAKGTNLEGQKTRDIFSAIAEASTALQLSSDETSGALYAISQMISKGKVSSEELRQQLGERLPGAFNLAAQAMGVTAAELDKMLQKGEVYAGDFLPRFAAALREHYAGAIEKAGDSTSANIARMQTAFFDLKVSIGDTFGNETAALIRGLTGLLRDMESAVYRVQGAIGKMVAYYDSIPDWIKTAAKLGGKAFMGSPFKSASYPSMADEAKALGIASGQTQQAHLESLVAGRPAGGSSGGGSSKASKGLSDVEKAAKKAAEEYERLSEKADEFVRKAAQDVELGSLTGLRKALRENEIEYENTLKTYEKLTGTKKAEAEAAALSIKAMKDQQAVGKETEDQRKKAVDAAKEMAEREKRLADIEKEKADKIKEAYEAYLKMIDGAARFYSEISGYENQYRDYAFKVIDEEAKARAQMYKDDVAAAKWAAERKGEFEQELFERKARLVSDGFGDMATAFDGISRLYEEGSEDAKKWEEASQAMEIAQRAVAVVNAVAAIANQGLGDPYTAFARIAAMAAAMGALLATIGESVGGGGGGGSSSKPYAYSGPDTVLGGAEGEASQSVQKSMELLQDTYSMEYEQLSRLNDQVKELNLNITGLVAGVLRDVGVNVNSFGIKSGTTPGLAHSTYEKYFENIIGSMAGNPFKMFGLNKPIAALIGGYDPLGAMLTKLVAPLFGKVANALFGGDVEVSKKGSGIGITFGSGAGKYSGAPKSTMTIADLMAGREAYVYNYAKAKITTDGGLFGSDKTKKIFQSAAASDDISRMFGLVFENMSMTLFELGKGLGADMAAVMGYAFQSFRLDFRKKSEEEIQKMIEDQINLMADTAAAALFGSLIKQYQQLDEGLYQTAIRLVQEKAVVGELMEMTNIAFPDAAGAAIEFSRSLIDLAGDLETLQEAVGNYYDKFFSDAEKQARLQLNLSEIMGQFNQQLPAARDGYRAIVESLDMTTDYGKEAYITLISLADSADKYYSYLEDQAGSFDQEMQNNASLFRTREDYIRALNTGKSEDTPEARDRKEMLAELKQLRTAMEAQGYQTVKNTKKTADIIEEWKIIGMPATQTA